MFTFTTIFFVTVTLLIIYLYYKGRKNGNMFNNIATLIQTIVAIWAIWFALKSVKDNNELMADSIIQIKKQDSISNITISELKSISGISNKLKENFDTINSRMSKIPSQIDDITNNFSSIIKDLTLFPSKIDSMSINLAKMNKIINEQKEIAEEELNRRPILKDSNFSFDGEYIMFDIFNVGDISAIIENINIMIPDNICIHHVIIDNIEATTVPHIKNKFQRYGQLYEIYQGSNITVKIELQYEMKCIEEWQNDNYRVDIQLLYKSINQRSGNYIFSKNIILSKRKE